MSDTDFSKMRRRTFMKWGAAVGGAAMAPLPFKAVAAEEPEPLAGDANTAWSACMVNCGSRCALRFIPKME